MEVDDEVVILPLDTLEFAKENITKLKSSIKEYRDRISELLIKQRNLENEKAIESKKYGIVLSYWSNLMTVINNILENPKNNNEKLEKIWNLRENIEDIIKNDDKFDFSKSIINDFCVFLDTLSKDSNEIIKILINSGINLEKFEKLLKDNIQYDIDILTSKENEEKLKFEIKKREKLEIEYERLLKQNASLKITINSKNFSSSQINDDVSQIKLEKEDYCKNTINSEQNKLCEALSLAKKEIKDLTTRLQTSESVINKLNTEKEKFLIESNNTRHLTNLTVDRVLSSDLYNSLKERCEQYKRDSREITKEINAIRVREKNDDSYFHQLHNENRAQKNLYEKKICSLDDQIIDYKNKEKNWKLKYEKLENEYNILKLDMDKLKKDNYNLIENLNKFKDSSERYKKLKEKHLSECDRLRDSNKKILDELQKIQISTKPQNDPIVVLVKQQEHNFILLKNQNKNLKEEITRLADEMEDISTAYEQELEIKKAYENEIQIKEKKILESIKIQNELETLKLQYINTSSLAEQRIKILVEQKKHSEKNSSAYDEAYKAFETQTNLLNEEIALLQERVNECEERNSVDSIQIDNLEIQLAQTKEEVDSKASLLQDATQKIVSLETEIIYLTTTNKNLKKSSINQTNNFSFLQPGENSTLTTDPQLLQQENIEIRRRLTCTVCNENFRDHIISLCGHVFCKECLDTSVRARNRKCPHCNLHFDQKNIKKIFLD